MHTPESKPRYLDIEPLLDVFSETSIRHAKDNVSLESWLQNIFDFDPDMHAHGTEPTYTTRNLNALRAIITWLETHGKCVD